MIEIGNVTFNKELVDKLIKKVLKNLTQKAG